jgi:uncharacterized protein
MRIVLRMALLGMATAMVLATCGPRGSTTGAGTLWVRSSEYVAVRDGTRLAVDIFRPVRDGKVVAEPLPVIWIHHRYQRAKIENGTLKTILDQTPWLTGMLERGYIVAAADARGSGASFGIDRGPMHPDAVWDMYDINEWLAAQPWSNGNIGMFGRSAMGQAQLVAASTAPPHLRAIFPQLAPLDGYESIYPGGVLRSVFVSTLGPLLQLLDLSSSPAPVDADPKGELLAQAIQERKQNAYPTNTLRDLPFRDDPPGPSGPRPWIDGSPYLLIDAVRRSGIPVALLTGWHDFLSRDTILWYANIDNPRRLIIGPWYHDDEETAEIADEHMRWFDYWLKGIENGIRDEAPIRYYTIGAPSGEEWRGAWRWPIADTLAADLYFWPGRSGTVRSANDGTLVGLKPPTASGQDTVTVDYSATSGQRTRWSLIPGGSRTPDLSANDRKGLTYTTAPFTSDVEITGHPVAHLWVGSTADDGDFFVYLEDVDPSGSSRPISDGVLRASHRKLAEPPYDTLGLPYHRSFRADIEPLAPGPNELILELSPTSYVVKAGRRLRVTVTGADNNNAETPILSPPPQMSIYYSPQLRSYVTLPVIQIN